MIMWVYFITRAETGVDEALSSLRFLLTFSAHNLTKAGLKNYPWRRHFTFLWERIKVFIVSRKVLPQEKEKKMFETARRTNIAIIKAKEVIAKSDDKTKVNVSNTFLSYVQMILDIEHDEKKETERKNLEAMKDELALEIVAF